MAINEHRKGKRKMEKEEEEKCARVQHVSLNSEHEQVSILIITTRACVSIKLSACVYVFCSFPLKTCHHH